jgi:hypothetical protein
MGEVVIRAAPEDRALADRLADALHHEGMLAEVVDADLALRRPAKAEIVIWREGSVASDALLSATREAFDADRLIGVRTGKGFPAPYSANACTDLSGFDGNIDHPGFCAIVRAVARHTLRAGPPPRAGRLRPLGMIGGVMAASVLAMMVFFWLGMPPG